MSAQRILENKGYDNFECSEILQSNDDNLDMRVREKYELGSEALHLWAEYEIGDADEEVVLIAAKKNGFEDIDDLLTAMDNDLLELAENFPSK